MSFFREVDGLIDLDGRTICQKPGKIQQPLEPFLIGAAMDQGAYGNGPHVHHGVEVLAVQYLVGVVDGIERLAGGLYPHVGPDGIYAVVQKGLEKEDRLDNALDGKGHVPVSFLLEFAGTGQKADAQVPGVAFLQLRDVAGYLSAGGIFPARRQGSLQRKAHKETSFVLERWTKLPYQSARQMSREKNFVGETGNRLWEG